MYAFDNKKSLDLSDQQDVTKDFDEFLSENI